MKNEQVAHDLAIFIMNNSHRLDVDEIDYTTLNTDDLVTEYKKLYNKIFNQLN